MLHCMATQESSLLKAAHLTLSPHAAQLSSSGMMQLYPQQSFWMQHGGLVHIRAAVLDRPWGTTHSQSPLLQHWSASGRAVAAVGQQQCAAAVFTYACISKPILRSAHSLSWLQPQDQSGTLPCLMHALPQGSAEARRGRDRVFVAFSSKQHCCQ